MEGMHDWPSIIARLDALRDARLYDRALDAQFEYGSSGNHYRSEAVKALVARGAKPTHRHLVIAVWWNDVVLAHYLLENGVPTRGKIGEGNALSYAVNNGNTVLARALLAKGADVNAQDDSPDYLKRPLYHAADIPDYTVAKEMIGLLLRHGADPTLPARDGDTETIWENYRYRARVSSQRAKWERSAQTETLKDQSVAVWRWIKPIVERRLGHPVAD